MTRMMGVIGSIGICDLFRNKRSYIIAFGILSILLSTSTSCDSPAINQLEDRERVKEEIPVSEASVEDYSTSDSIDPKKEGDSLKEYTEPPEMIIDTTKGYSATIQTSEGSMKFELFVDDAPITVNNFVFLAQDGFYDGVIFHRIIKGFMIQSGDPTGTGTGGPGYRFQDEYPITRDYLKGTLAMANAGPDTNGSQFFVMHGDMGLPKNYTIFGQLTEGLDVLDVLANTPVTGSSNGELSKPITPPKITVIDITMMSD